MSKSKVCRPPQIQRMFLFLRVILSSMWWYKTFAPSAKWSTNTEPTQDSYSPFAGRAVFPNALSPKLSFPISRLTPLQEKDRQLPPKVLEFQTCFVSARHLFHVFCANANIFCRIFSTQTVYKFSRQRIISPRSCPCANRQWWRFPPPGSIRQPAALPGHSSANTSVNFPGPSRHKGPCINRPKAGQAWCCSAMITPETGCVIVQNYRLFMIQRHSFQWVGPAASGCFCVVGCQRREI